MCSIHYVEKPASSRRVVPRILQKVGSDSDRRAELVRTHRAQ
jgi:hypothetical protein